jgi:hypothetical protein
VILVGACPTLFGGQGMITGAKWSTWDKDNISVVIGRLSDPRQIPGIEQGLYEAKLAPTATLAGRFDPSLHPQLKVRFYAGVSGTSIDEVPPKVATVLAVIGAQILVHDELVPSDWIESSLCMFMPEPNFPALLVIRGFDDPRVAETLKKIQAARANSTTQPSDRPATHPTTQPGE